MRVIMPAIIDQAGRPFNVDEADGVNRRHRPDQSRQINHLRPAGFWRGTGRRPLGNGSTTRRGVKAGSVLRREE